MNRVLAVAGLYNIRDLGGLPSTYSATTVYRRFLRSDSPHAIDETGKTQLLELGVRTIIDLRYADECLRTPNPLAAHPQVEYHNIPLMVSGVIENNAEDLTQLGAFYRFLLHNSQPAFARVFTTMAEHNGTTLFHCQVGKDRTGVVAALLLSLAGTPQHHIIEDYVATATHIAPLLPELRLHRPDRINAEQYERLLDARAEFINEFLHEVTTRYDNAQQYLLRIGVSEFHIDSLRNTLIHATN
ncbi:MAG: tyrosine-protein phosphatase [Chloroflexota bacterium]|jgi:protein-tyrosine phosphatase